MKVPRIVDGADIDLQASIRSLVQVVRLKDLLISLQEKEIETIKKDVLGKSIQSLTSNILYLTDSEL